MGKALEKLWQSLGWLDNVLTWVPGIKLPEIGIFIVSIINSLFGMSPWNAGIIGLLLYWIYKKLFEERPEPLGKNLEPSDFLKLKSMEVKEKEKRRQDYQKLTLELAGIIACLLGLLFLVTCGIYVWGPEETP